MGHDWIFDVLADLKTYAVANGLVGLAAKADEALQIAQEEIGTPDPSAGVMRNPKVGFSN